MLSSFCSSSLSKACLKLIAQSNIMHTRLIASWHLRSYSLRVAVPPPPSLKVKRKRAPLLHRRTTWRHYSENYID